MKTYTKLEIDKAMEAAIGKDANIYLEFGDMVFGELCARLAVEQGPYAPVIELASALGVSDSERAHGLVAAMNSWGRHLTQCLIADGELIPTENYR